MKVIRILFFLFLMAQASFAQVNLMLGYSTAGSFQVNTTSPVAANASSSLSGGLVLGAEYSDRLSDAMGFQTGLLYYVDQTANQCTATAGTCTVAANNGFGTTLLYGNFRILGYAPWEFFVGVNYGFPRINPPTSTYSGKIGYQAGIGYQLSERFSVVGTYRITFFDGVPSAGVQYGNVNATGLELGLKYAL